MVGKKTEVFKGNTGEGRRANRPRTGQSGKVRQHWFRGWKACCETLKVNARGKPGGGGEEVQTKEKQRCQKDIANCSDRQGKKLDGIEKRRKLHVGEFTGERWRTQGKKEEKKTVEKQVIFSATRKAEGWFTALILEHKRRERQTK